MLAVSVAISTAAGAQTASPVASTIRLQVGSTAHDSFIFCGQIGTRNEILTSLVTGKGSTSLIKTPGALTTGEIVCVQDFSTDQWLWDWRSDVARNAPGARKNAVLSLLDSSGRPIVTWTMTNVWPSQVFVDFRHETVVFEADSLVRQIVRATPSITWNPQALTYGTPLGSDQLNATSPVAGTFSYSTAAGTILPAGVQTLTVTFTPADTSQYAPATMNAQVTVMPAILTARAGDKTKVYGGTNPALTYTVDGFVNGENETVITGGSALLSTPTIDAGTPVGSYPIGITGSFTAPNYTFNYVNGTFSITPAPLKATADDKVRLYGADNPTFTGTLEGVVNGDGITELFDTKATPASPVGSYAIQPFVSDPNNRLGNYALATVDGLLNVTPASLEVTVANASRRYGAPDPAFTGTMTGLLNGDPITETFTTNAIVSSPVGFYTITPGLADPSNRLGNYFVTMHGATLEITKAPLTITGPTTSRLYGGPNPVFTGTVDGLLSFDAITITFTSTASPSSSVGTYPITSTIADPGNRLGNYDVTRSDGVLTVKPAPLTVNANSASRLYGAANPPLDGILIGLLNNDAISATFSTSATPASSVGTYPITSTLSDPNSRLGNYDVMKVDGVLTVLPAPLVATAANASKTYGSPNPPLTGILAGVVNNDPIAATFVTDATESSNAGPYTIQPLLSDPFGRLSNYNVTLNHGVLTIERAPLTVSADDKSMIYGDPVPALTAHFSGFVLSETAAVLTGAPALSTTATSTSAPGAYVITIAQGTLASPNYAFTFVPGTLTVIGSQTLITDTSTLVKSLQTPSLPPADSQKISAILDRLAASADSSLWTDSIHPTAKGGQTIFDNAKDAVLKLTDLLGSTTDPATAATLQTAIDSIVKACRVVAWASIDDAMKANGNAKSIAKAQTDLATGDSDNAAKRYSNAVLDYRNSWKDLH